jgi:hypothetical protein
VRQLGDLTPAEIRTAIPAVFPEDGHAESYQLLEAVANHLDSSRTEVPSGYRARRVLELYAGRVKAALVRLAAEGTLVRVGAREQPPGIDFAGSVHYYTPEGFAAAKARGEEREAAALSGRRRWQRVASRLSIAADVRLNQDGSLSLTDWEHLLKATGL